MRRIALAALLLGATACATPPPPEAPTAPPPPPLARAALEEWDAWGRIVVEGWPDSRPAHTAATPERFARLIGYWSVVPGSAGVVRRHVALRAAMAAMRQASGDASGGDAPVAAAAMEDIGLYAHPAWSAAFISAIARRAAVPEAALPSAARHARYIDAILARAAVDPTGAAFQPHAPEDQAPQPGDLLCADRSAAPLAHWTMRLLAAGRPRAMHCDVVVGVAAGMIEAIGGNVDDMVALRRLPADAQGRVLPAPPGEARFLLVLRHRDALSEHDPP